MFSPSHLQIRVFKQCISTLRTIALEPFAFPLFMLSRPQTQMDAFADRFGQVLKAGLPGESNSRTSPEPAISTVTFAKPSGSPSLPHWVVPGAYKVNLRQYELTFEPFITRVYCAIATEYEFTKALPASLLEEPPRKRSSPSSELQAGPAAARPRRAIVAIQPSELANPATGSEMRNFLKNNFSAQKAWVASSPADHGRYSFEFNPRFCSAESIRAADKVGCMAWIWLVAWSKFLWAVVWSQVSAKDFSVPWVMCCTRLNSCKTESSVLRFANRLFTLVPAHC